MLSKPNDDSDRVKIACLLLNNGARVDLQDKTGKTPLQVCKSPRVRSGVEDFIRQVYEQCVVLFHHVDYILPT